MRKALIGHGFSSDLLRLTQYCTPGLQFCA
jgi:hypothetical protein